MSKLQLYLEELEDQAKDLRQQRNDAARQFRLTDQYSTLLMRERMMHRTARGNSIKIHFSRNCPRYAGLEATDLCQKCVSGGGVTRIDDMS